MAPRKKIASVQRTAREKLGFECLRPGQEEAVRSILGGFDTVVIQPTGSGKSAIYQAAGLLMDGPTIVVSPLIALQKDQSDSITRQPHSAVAAILNSHRKSSENQQVLQDLVDGDLEFLLLAPEQLRKQATLEKLREAEPSLFVVDEAHCISEWGHNFRPDYLSLGGVIEELGHPVVAALTATAAPEVRNEIVSRLGLRNPAIFVRGFDRPNIHLRVDHFESEEEKTQALLKRVRWADKPGIVYAATRAAAESLAAAMIDDGVVALSYHGGMRPQERSDLQDRFMSGAADVIVATNAFGMGVDKADIRFVYHFDISDSLDSYYQEIGRGGRDGEPTEAVLFYRSQNLALRKFQAGGGKVDAAQLRAVASELVEGGTVESVSEDLGLSERKVIGSFNRLEDAGVIHPEKNNGEMLLRRGVTPEQAAIGAAEQQVAFHEAKRKRIETMQQYAEISTCRRRFLLDYFGDTVEAPCGNCDNDSGSEEKSDEVGTRREVQE